MKLSIIHDQGTSPYREDGFFVTENNLFGVLDGQSAPSSLNHPPIMFNGMSGGEMVSRLVEKFFGTIAARSEKTLTELIVTVNTVVRKVQKEVGIDLEDTGQLAGTLFALAKIGEEEIKVVQVGDCFAVIQLRNGEIIVSPNQLRNHDKEMREEIERLQREIAKELFNLSLKELSGAQHNKVRREMWNRFCHTLYQARKETANNPHHPPGYGILNGQPQLAKMLWKRVFKRKEVATLLLFTDGLVSWNVMKSNDDETIGKVILSKFKEKGFAGLLLEARQEEKKFAFASHIDEAEITAMALVF